MIPIWIALTLTVVLAPKEDGAPLPSVDEAVKGTTSRPGLLDLRIDDDRGRVLAVFRVSGDDGLVGRFLYVTGLATGLGSNPVGLDRGRVGTSRVVRFVRHGRKLFIEQENWKYRARSSNEEERRAVGESFAPSVLWGGDVIGRDEDGRFAVDLSGFVARDAESIARTLSREGGEGKGAAKYELDPKSSVVDTRACLSFPTNVELEARLTFRTKSDPGRQVSATAATGSAATIDLHHSLIALPDDDYRPRAAHPRAGYGAVSFLDYAVPLDAPIEQKWIRRHRLEKVDPTAARSKVKRPIVYYVDRGAPAQIRDALIEGASWWATAFEAAGFIDAFRVEVLPPDAHPLDARYHTIHWVHRSTRGWSYGGGVHDPRTGEMVKGNVRLGSLRVRQDRRLFEGLGAGRPVEVALARIRQLAAHEVGHTLGLQHNFCGSTYADRASVMDYPAPRVKIGADGALDFSDAYGVGVGAWDIWTIRYGYSQFASGVDEAAALQALIDEAMGAGLAFASDSDARALGSAHPLAHLWDNGADPIAELGHVMAVRRIALDAFAAPREASEETFVPVYLHHRYQVEATAKLIGGVAYDHGGGATEAVDAARQRAALAAVLGCLDPAELDVSERTLARLLPSSPVDGDSRERFEGATGPTFDPLSAAAAAADQVLGALLHPARLGRLVDQHRRDADQLGSGEVLDAVTSMITAGATSDARTDALREVVAMAAFDRVLALASSAASPLVRGSAAERIQRFADWEGRSRVVLYARHRAQAFLRGVAFPPAVKTNARDLPPGSPIGSDPHAGCGW